MVSAPITSTPAAHFSGALTRNAAPSTTLRIPSQPQLQRQEPRISHGTLRLPFFERNAIRYVSAHNPCITDSKKQDQLARSIWSRLRHLFPNKAQELDPRLDVDLAIVFDQIIEAGTSFATIDILCSSVQACEAVRCNVSKIELEDEDRSGRLITYKMHRWSGPPPPNFVVVHAKLPSLGASEANDFFKALRGAAAPIGRLAESVRVAAALRWPLNNEGEELERIAVAHINLAPSTLALSLPELHQRRVNSFQWKGVMGWETVLIEYQDRHLACYHRYAAEHPGRFVGPSRQPLDAWPELGITRIEEEDEEAEGEDEEEEAEGEDEEEEAAARTASNSRKRSFTDGCIM